MKHLLKLSVFIYILSGFSTPLFAQDFFTTGQPTITSEGNNYTISFSFDATKHSATSSVPLSKIYVSGGVYTKTTNELLLTINSKQPDSVGLFRHSISNDKLNPNTEYEIALSVSGEGKTESLPPVFFTTQKTTTVANKISTNDPNRYDLLAPIPGLKAVLDPVACEEARVTNPEEICDINQFINFMLQLIIGICAVILVVRLIIAGYAYMTTDVPFVKFGAKNTFYDALIGLLIALSSYLILNTINPRLVNNSFSLQQATFNVETFEISGALGGEFGTWKPVKVRLDKDVYPAAKKASEKTGVSIPYILAIFQQETGGGKNTGKCYWAQNGVMREDSERKDKTAFKTIMSELGQDPNTTPVSCALPGGGWGGAIGYTQFLPTTWLQFKAEGTRLLGRAPNPWKIEDALLMTAIYTKNLGALTNERDAACRYYSGSKCTPGRRPPNEFYGNEVMRKKAGFEKEIEKLKKEGKIQ